MGRTTPLLLLLVAMVTGTGSITLREQLGYPIDDPGMLYHDDPNLVRQVILMNPSQQIQSDDVLIKSWTVRWDYLRTRIRLQLWRQTGPSPGHFTLQSQTQEMTSNRTGRVTFDSSYSLVAQHGDVLGIYLVTENPIPYRKPVGECNDLRTMVWQLTHQNTPSVKNTYVFQSVTASDLCRQYLIEPEFELQEYATGENGVLLGSNSVERSMTDTDKSVVIVPNPNIQLPYKSTVIGWQAYFAKPLTKVRFSVLTPNGTDQWRLAYVSGEYLVSQLGLFYARISHYNITIVPQGSVIALNFTGENPIPYDVASVCNEAKTGLYQSVQKTMASGPFTMMPLTENPCRDYSFQLVYEKFEARYPRECSTPIASTQLQESKSYSYDEGISISSTKQCWEISAQTVGGGVVEMKVLDLHLTADNCSEDGLNFVEIRDGNRDGPLLKRVCPGDQNVTVISCSSSLHVYMKTTESTGKRGLWFSYATVLKEGRPCPLQSASQSSGSDSHGSACLMLLLAIYTLYSVCHGCKGCLL